MKSIILQQLKNQQKVAKQIKQKIDTKEYEPMDWSTLIQKYITPIVSNEEDEP